MNFFKRNIGLKLLALVLSFVACVAVHVLTEPTNENTVAHRVYTLPISFVSPGQDLVYSTDINEVVVTLRGSLSLLDRITPELISAEVNLAGASKPGSVLESVEVVAPGGVYVSNVDPAYIWVKFSSRQAKEVPVRVTLQGQVKSGFSVGTPDVEPAKVRIVGADEIVAQVVALRAPLAVSHSSRTFSAIVRTLMPVGMDGKEVAGVKMATNSVNVTVPIYALHRAKVSLDNIKVQPANQKMQYTVSVEPLNVLCECEDKSLAPEVVLTENKTIELTNERAVVTVPLVVPDSIRLASGVSDNVVVTVTPKTVSSVKRPSAKKTGKK